MCGRYAIFGPRSTSREEKKLADDLFDAGTRTVVEDGPFEWAGATWLGGNNYDASPTEVLPIYRREGEGAPALVPSSWWLVPEQAESPAAFRREFKTFNARSDRMMKSQVWRRLLPTRRCLVPMRGFYEWQPAGGHKVRHFIHMKDEPAFACAGLWDRWKSKDGESVLESFTIIVCEPNALLEKLHSDEPRMPVILPPELQQKWLAPHAEVDELLAMLAPYPAEKMSAHPVQPKGKGPELTEPAGASLQNQPGGTITGFRVVYFPELKLGEARSVAQAWAERKKLRIALVDRKVGAGKVETIELHP